VVISAEHQGERLQQLWLVGMSAARLGHALRP
jgi:hypothetical protein